MINPGLYLSEHIFLDCKHSYTHLFLVLFLPTVLDLKIITILPHGVSNTFLDLKKSNTELDWLMP